MDPDDPVTVRTGTFSTGARTNRQTTTAEMAAPVPSEIGDRYRVQRMLGEGGMGKVLLCGDEVIGRRVAMKVLKTEGAGPEERADSELRFLREARIQGQLEHPAVVPVYDLASDAHGGVFFTMKRVRGVTLSDILKLLRSGDPEAEAMYSLRRLLAAFGSVCLCVDFAHEHGVVHRDLKPANIMLGNFGEVYVLDWGIARVVSEPELERTSALVLGSSAPEQTGSLVGTIGYMPPEQVREGVPDARSDVYALGAILFELLTRERLHAGATFDEIASSTLAGAEARPSVRAPALAIAPALDDICLRATALAPDDRFPTARALHEALERYLDREQSIVVRREAAIEHLAAASDHMRALAGESTHRKVLREVGQAVALDPHNPEAVRAVAHMLATPLPRTPVEVVERLERTDRRRRRYMATAAGASYATWFLYMPVVVAMGIRNWPVFLGLNALAAVTALWALLAGRRKNVGWGTTYAVLAMTNLTFAAASVLFGPLIMTPAPIIANAIGFALLYPDRKRRVIAIAAGVLALVAPLGLQLAGVVPASYEFSSAGMLVKPLILDLPPALTLLVLVIMNATPIIVGGLAVGKLRDALYEAETKVHTQAWQLRQLLPDDTLPQRR